MSAQSKGGRGHDPRLSHTRGVEIGQEALLLSTLHWMGKHWFLLVLVVMDFFQKGGV